MARILVIDDDPQIRAMLRMILENEGYEVMDAPDGEIAMDLYKEHSADMIITDIVMPEKEGIELIIEFRQNHPQVKIIAMSGGGLVASDQYLELADKFGAHRTFEKPFNPMEMLKAVQELVDS